MTLLRESVVTVIVGVSHGQQTLSSWTCLAAKTWPPLLLRSTSGGNRRQLARQSQTLLPAYKSDRNYYRGRAAFQPARSLAINSFTKAALSGRLATFTFSCGSD